MLEIAIVAGLILLNGVFALSELAIVSARKARLKSMADSGRAGAATALGLAENPGKFLSTVQIGITLIGIVAGAFSGATLGGDLTDALMGMGVPAGVAGPLGYGGVVVIITYLSVVIGELVPKQLALRNAEAIACTMAPLMRFISVAAAPAVWLLDASTRLIFRLIGQSEVAENLVTEEEIKTLVAEAATSGVIETDERRMIDGVLRLSDRTARSVMTPRTDVDWIDIQDPPEKIRATLIETRHSRLPVADGNPDNVIGVVMLRECLGKDIPDKAEKLRPYIHTVPIIPDTLPALDVLEALRQSEYPMILVLDEYGHFEGIVTPADVLEAIAGVFRSELEADEGPDTLRRPDGSWLLSGSLPAEGLTDTLGIILPPKRDYQTAAGFVIEQLQHLPKVGESITVDGWCLEIVDMDGRRIDKLLATLAPDPGGTIE